MKTFTNTDNNKTHTEHKHAQTLVRSKQTLTNICIAYMYNVNQLSRI